jgi:hypothetical protein
MLYYKVTMDKTTQGLLYYTLYYKVTMDKTTQGLLYYKLYFMVACCIWYYNISQTEVY